MIPPPQDAATPPVERVGPHHSSDTVHRNENEQARAGQVDGVVDMSVQGQDPFNLSRVLQTLGLGGQRGWGFSDVDGCLAVALCFFGIHTGRWSSMSSQRGLFLFLYSWVAVRNLFPTRGLPPW